MLRRLHLATVILVTLQVVFAVTNMAVYERRPLLAEMVVQAHLSCGALIFCLTVTRLFVRFSLPTPALPQTMTLPARWAALVVHGALYNLLLLLPISGYLKLAALGFQVTLFGALPLPALPFDPHLAESARLFHDRAAVLLGTLVAGHIGAALFHQRLFGQPVLGRMFPQRARGQSATA